MSLKNLLNQIIGSTGDASAPSAGTAGQGIGDTLRKVAENVPGGLAGGAAAGGIVALLMGNKSARKFAGKAATYGGAAVLGGLAYNAWRNWQQSPSAQGTQAVSTRSLEAIAPPEQQQPAHELTLIKAMIAAAKADGHIDGNEQQRIFQAVDASDLTAESKGAVFDYLRQPIPVEELASDVTSLEQKSEIYLASCLVVDPDHPVERAHLDRLALALGLPDGFARHLESQASASSQTSL